jgi:membrane-bound ClpP family serine protease
VVAVAQFVFSAYLSAAWGAVCLVLGAVNLAFPRRGMLITNGVAMILVGIGNFTATLYSGRLGMMTYLGVVQVVWGFKELRRYSTGEVKR